MITIRIDEEKLKEMLSKHFKEHLTSLLKDSSMLEYWIKTEVYKLLAKDLFEKKIQPMFTDDKIAEMLQKAFNSFVYEKFNKEVDVD